MILVLGCGTTGVSVANFLFKNAQKFIVADSNKYPHLAKFLPNCDTFFGDLDTAILKGVNKIVISPGIAPDIEFVKFAIKQDIVIISDIDLFYQQLQKLNKAPILIGITGTNGKSSTVKLLEYVLQGLGNSAIACGNIGMPILDAGFNFDYYIIELSSYQLDYINITTLRYGLILNISPDHLDRYKTFAKYRLSKLKIHQISEDNIINSANNFAGFTANFTNGTPKKNEFGVVNNNIVFNNNILLEYKNTKLLGKHNLENILAVFAICHKLKLNLLTVSSVICKFSGLKHRLEFVKRIRGVDFYNDSKATNVSSAIAAINTLDDKYTNIALIVGGAQKNEDYLPLFNEINKKIAQVVLIGSSSDDFSDYIHTEKIQAKSMQKAVDLAKNLSYIDCVALVPGCASFDSYDNFEKRGNDFKKWIKQ